MTALKTIAIGAAGAAMLVGGAAPAAAQYYPGYPGTTNPANVIGQVINQVLNPYGNQYGYGYGVNSQMAVQRCTAAVQRRLQLQYRAGYSPYGYNTATSARVLGISRIEQRSRGTVRVRGVASSGRMYGGYPYGGYPYGGYGYGYAQAQSPDLIFRCDVGYRGYIRDIDIDRID